MKLPKVETGLLQIGGTFPHTFFEKSKQKNKQWHTTGKRTSHNSGCQKKKFKIVLKKFKHKAWPICNKLDSTVACSKVLQNLPYFSNMKIRLIFWES